MSRRQRIRSALILISFLLFPIIMNYMSPYVIIDGAAHGIVNGSFIVFGSLFLSALFLGRLWCGWLCPAAGLQEMCLAINDRPARGGRWNWTKWGIWVAWLGTIGWAATSAGGYRQVDFLYLTEKGISVSAPPMYIVYYTVIGIFMVLAITLGRRAGCHYLCWMAPFVIAGRKIASLVNWPALRLRATPERCIDCKRCTKACPMSLEVNRMARSGTMEHDECILCGNCVDTCPKDVIAYTFSARARPRSIEQAGD
jgi:ferredoxin-type protein NapH